MCENILKIFSLKSHSVYLHLQRHCTGSCNRCAIDLIRRIQQNDDFPHEIGLFLGCQKRKVLGLLNQGPVWSE